jgi:hypothetical protein
MDNNPNFEWRFRVRYYVNPDHSGSLLLRIKVGKVKMGSGNGNGNGNGAGANAFENIHAILRSIPLPAKGAAGPRQNCVGWIRAAIRKLQANGLAEEFDVDAFMANALAFVDRRLTDVDRVPDVIDHLGKRI